jgi:flagellar protein FliS
MKTLVDAQQSYREIALQGATPIELVVALYDAAIEDMRYALTAMQQNDMETRARQIGHALIVLQQLQGTLDFERGGSAARQFEQFYNLVRAKLLEAQIRNSSDLLREQIRYFSEVRDCWIAAKRALQPAMRSTALPSRVTAEEKLGVRIEWSA